MALLRRGATGTNCALSRAISAHCLHVKHKGSHQGRNLLAFWARSGPDPVICFNSNPVHWCWCVCLIWSVQTLPLLNTELAQSCLEEQDVKSTSTPAKPDLYFLATGNRGADVWCWDFPPKISLPNAHFMDLLLPCTAQRGLCCHTEGGKEGIWQLSSPFWLKFCFCKRWATFQTHCLGSPCYLLRVEQCYCSLDSWAFAERGPSSLSPKDVTG